MKKENFPKGNVNILWTGGWDSTFQLLSLLLLHGRKVTPYYLIDAERLSTVSYGEEQPLDSEDLEKNRRAEFVEK